MKPTSEILERIERCSSEHKDGVFTRLYRYLLREDIYYAAYQKLYANKGATTQGIDDDTADGFSDFYVKELIQSLKDGTYKANPVRRGYIPKKNGKLRPLGIPSFRDKLLQEVVRMILEAIYEPVFDSHSHGFRPGKSCHTALRQISSDFTGVVWFIEGDIQGCFDNINHEKLIEILSRKIKDSRFLNIIRQFLKAGYIENWKYNATYSGSPQGGICSPILANIYLNELDKKFREIAERFDKPRSAYQTPEYHTASKELKRLSYWIDHTDNEAERQELPEEAKKYFKYEEYGRDAVSKDKGQFTEQGYIYNNQNTFTEWYRGTENEIPKEYRVMSFPQPERGGQDKTFMDAAATEQTARTAAEQPQEPHPVIPIVLTAGKPAEKLKEITDRLEQGITELFDSERYKEYLKVMSKFHNYSFRNTVLIAMQKPDASLLAGFSAWKNNFERNVMRGQKGIKIIAPSPYKIKQEMQKIDPHTQKPIIGKDGKPVTEEKEITIPAYKVVSVFDVSQTEGKELPDIAVDELTGDVDRYKDFFAALEKTSPVPIAFENIEGGSHGYYHLEDKRIAINEGMSELQTLKTAIHEIAHAKLHDIDLNAPKDEQPRVDRRTREVEAESVAYTVCQHYGLDTSDYSFGYVAGWSSGRELSELKSSLETIRSAAAEIINSIDANFAELQKAQDKEQTAGQEQPTREGQEAAPQPEAPKKADTAGKEKPEAAPKEAFTPETIYRVRRNPYSDSRENSHLLQAYVTQENGRAKMGDVLYTGTPEKCRELMGQLKSGELTEGDVKQLYAKAQETAQTTGQDKDTFSIYQIKGGDETRDFRFEPYDRLQAAGNVVDKANYELVYSAPLAPETSLEDIYTRFNIDHPKDFKGHSLSVSDVVVLHQNGQDTAHYVDSVGFRQVPEFLQEQKQLTPDELTTGETIQTPRGTFHVTAMSREQIEAAGYGFHHQSDDGKYLIMGNGTRAFAVAAEQPEKANPLKHIEDTVEQNDNNFDGIINNTPTVDELEAKVKAGETISLVDLANAVKADKERGKEAKPEKKPSIRAQLRADKEKAQKKNAKQKLQDLERS